jgi:glucokinase
MTYVIALDIGGTNCRVALIDETYQLVSSYVEDTHVGDRSLFLTQVEALIRRFDTYLPFVRAISLGVPGRVDAHEFIPILPNIKIHDVPLKTYLSSRFLCPVFIRNDAVMAALAEGNLGHGRSYRSSYFMTISTGIGGALIRDHQLAYSSEEIGHMLVPYNNTWIELEQRGSGTGIVKLAQDNGLTIDSSRTFWQRVGQKDSQTQTTYDAWIRIMRHTLTFIDTYFQPDIFIFSGGVMRNEALFFHDFKTMLPHRHMVIAELGQNAGLLGAAYLGFSLTQSTEHL